MSETSALHSCELPVCVITQYDMTHLRVIIICNDSHFHRLRDSDDIRLGDAQIMFKQRTAALIKLHEKPSQYFLTSNEVTVLSSEIKTERVSVFPFVRRRSNARGVRLQQPIYGAEPRGLFHGHMRERHDANICKHLRNRPRSQRWHPSSRLSACILVLLVSRENFCSICSPVKASFITRVTNI